MDIDTLLQAAESLKDTPPLVLTTEADRAVYQAARDQYDDDDPRLAKPTKEKLSKNFNKLLKKAKRLVEAAKQNYGIERLNKLAEEVGRVCDISTLCLMHNCQFPHSIGVDDAFERIMLSKKLLSSKAVSEEEDPMVYMSAHPKEYTPPSEEGPYFMIRNVPEDLWKRSALVLSPSPNDDSMHIGGNHAQVGWKLATLINAIELMRPDSALNVSLWASETLHELQIPNEVDLRGHSYVKDGEETTIPSGQHTDRAAKKSGPRKR